MLLNISAQVFNFCSLWSPLSLILFIRLFCNSMFQKCLSFYVCENLSKRSVKWRKAINEMNGNNPDENFLGANFPGGSFRSEEFDGWEFFRWYFPRGKEFSYNHFLHIMYLFLFSKKLSINIIRPSTKRYIL